MAPEYQWWDVWWDPTQQRFIYVWDGKTTDYLLWFVQHIASMPGVYSEEWYTQNRHLLEWLDGRR